MIKKLILSLGGLMLSLSAMSQVVDVLVTSDVHGNLFPRNFIERIDEPGSLAALASYLDSFNRANTLLMDNGDLLQGQPPVYYYNYVDTVNPHIAALALNYLGYDAASVGNHDIETGHKVYDRFNEELNLPLLAANAINILTNEPYFQPYAIFEKGGKRIAVLGLITPAIPAWLPKSLWEGMRFDDMVKTAKKWMPIIKEQNPDLIIGLFHSGNDSSRNAAGFNENASIDVAKEVPGFDLIFTGHDHIPANIEVTNVAGGKVRVLNPGSQAHNVAHATVTFEPELSIIGKIESLANEVADSAYMALFDPEHRAVEKYIDQKIGNASGDFSSKESLFGPSAYMNLLHNLQLAISGADISFAAPLSRNTVIRKGDITIADMFKLYKYENSLYVLELTGQEIHDYLEKSYALWTYELDTISRNGLLNRKNPSYNYDSASGIDYIVDVTKPEGDKVTILGFSNGANFNPDATYTVAVNSYRAEGGGDLLTKGAGIPRDSLSERVIWRSDRDLRHYLVEQITALDTIVPSDRCNWRFVPDNIAAKAIAIDRDIEEGKGAIEP